MLDRLTDGALTDCINLAARQGMITRRRRRVITVTEVARWRDDGGRSAPGIMMTKGAEVGVATTPRSRIPTSGSHDPLLSSLRPYFVIDGRNKQKITSQFGA